jgi:RimJ/RimL family protein N-acetyltransferase
MPRTTPIPSDTRLSLRTARLELRPTRIDDWAMLWPHVADPLLSRWMTWDPHRDEGVTREFLASTLRGRLDGRGFVWVLLEGGAFRGVVGIESVQRQVLGVRMDKAELGYWITRDAQRRGLATEAASAAIAAGFRLLRLHKIWVRVMTPNTASIRVVEKLGFTRVGVERRELLRRGRWTDVARYEMLADDDAARRILRLHV